MEVRLGWQALEQLHPKTAPPEEEFLKARPPVRLDAMESYVRGLRRLSGAASSFLTQAARLDAHYSQPCFQLGKTFGSRKTTASRGLVRARQPLRPALSGSAVFSRAVPLLWRRFQGAEQAFQIVAASVPLTRFTTTWAPPSPAQRFRRRRRQLPEALEGDDADPDYHFNLGCVLWQSGQYAEAVESFRAAVARNPDDAEATLMLGRALKQEGPRPGDPRTQAHERLKTNYEETAYRQLQASWGSSAGATNPRVLTSSSCRPRHFLDGGGLDAVYLREILVEIGFA